ncbi:unnamed protein product [Lactuca saligna]|uniref:Pentatricopeptide repeat-containing protein n=1 Tax=Lactuca saligna TaxID=75948 RepID=A0AA35ZR91_LACSI|nr:unnamed protein product [Lactuca saligna]
MVSLPGPAMNPFPSDFNGFPENKKLLWYRPNSAIYVKLIVMLGKCKQPKRANSLFQAMIDEGCDVNQESYIALLSVYSRSGLFRKAFSILKVMKNTPNCHPDVYTYSILIKSCLHFHEFDKVQSLLSEMFSRGVNPNTFTYNTPIDAYGKAKRFADMESTLVEMLRQRESEMKGVLVMMESKGCEPDKITYRTMITAYNMNGMSNHVKELRLMLSSVGKSDSR